MSERFKELESWEEAIFNKKEDERKMHTFSLVGTDAQMKKLVESFIAAGWKFGRVGVSGSWLGEPIIEVTKEPGDESNE